MVGASIELGAFLLVGLLGGAHCLGMCGPLVTMYASAHDQPSGRVTLGDVSQQALFSLGRVGAYALLGALFGLAGSVLATGGRLLAVADLVRGMIGICAGLAILMVGMGYLRGRPIDPGRFPVPGVDRVFTRLTEKVGTRANRWAAGPQILLLGTVHALLPCPLLYPAYLYAFARGSPTVGAAALTALGLGTVPPLVGYATVIEAVPAQLRGHLHRALGAAFLPLGLVPFVHGLRLLGAPLPPVHLPHYAGVPTP